MESEETLRQWIRQARAGDRDAFDRLIGRHRNSLEAAIRRRMGGYLRQKIDAEDVLQETFLKALESIRSYREEGPDSFLHWLRGIAENLLLYWARQYRRTRQLPPDREVAGSSISPSRKMRREERFEHLQEALSRLSPEHREVILMARVEGLPIREIARRLDRSPAATKQLLWRAIGKLGECFGETESLHLPPKSLLEGGKEDAT